MAKVSQYRQKLIQRKKEQAYYLHKEGYTLRDIGKILDMSHEWVRTAVEEMTRLDKNPEEAYTGIIGSGSGGKE